MQPDAIARYFTRPDGTFLFKRWPVPMVAGVFGPSAPDHKLIDTVFAEVEALTGHPIKIGGDGTDMNATLWFLNDWGDLLKIPGTGFLLGALGGIVKGLANRKASLRRSFTDDPVTGGIGKLAFIVRPGQFATEDSLDEKLRRIAIQTQLLWAIGKDFPGVLSEGPDGTKVIRPEVKAILSVAYDPSLPHVSTDPALAVQIADLIAARGA